MLVRCGAEQQVSKGKAEGEEEEEEEEEAVEETEQERDCKSWQYEI